MGSESTELSVMHVITGLHTGGAERLLTTSAIDAHRHGNGVSVVSLIPGGQFREELQRAGVPVYDLGMARGRPSLGAMWRLARIIRRDRPAIIQSWMYHANLLALASLLLSGRRRSTRLYWGIFCSELDFSQYGRMLRLVVEAGARLSPLTNGIVYNNRVGMTVHSGFGFRAPAATLIENGVDLERFRPDLDARAEVRRRLAIPEDALVAIAVARVDPMKDWDNLLMAIAEIGELHTLLVGEGTEKFPARPGQYRLGRRDDLPELLAAADFFVMSSAFGEGASVALTEAMAAGLPLVLTDVGDNARVADGCGIVVPPRDSVALADGIRRMMSDAAARRNFGIAARTRALRHFSLDQASWAYRSFYQGRNEPSGGAELSERRP